MQIHGVVADQLGKADLVIGGLRIWTHSRKYPESSNFWDVNWLNATFECRTDSSCVLVSGDILHNTEIAEWIDAIQRFNEELPEEIILPTWERYLRVKMRPETYRRISATAEISNRCGESHVYEFWMPEDSLSAIRDGLWGILEKFPILK